MGGKQRHALGEVDGRAPADGDDAVAALAAILFQRRDHRPLGGVGRRIEEHRRLGRQMRQRLGHQPGCKHAAIGDQQRPVEPELLHRLGKG
jgi:hypothetical protein